MAKVVSVLREVANRADIRSEPGEPAKSSALSAFLGAVLIVALIAGSLLLVYIAMNMTSQ